MVALCVREAYIPPYKHQACSCDLFWQVDPMTYSYQSRNLKNHFYSFIFSPFSSENGMPQNEKAQGKAIHAVYMCVCVHI